MNMYPLLVYRSSSTGAQCFPHALVGDCIAQEIVFALMNDPGVEELFFHGTKIKNPSLLEERDLWG